jgi:hypothetical protein
MEDLGDFRRGAISLNYRKCGKSDCACARKDHPGHGQQNLWNVSVGGKTQARNLPLGPELEKAESGGGTIPRVSPPIPRTDRVQRPDLSVASARAIEDDHELEQLKKNCGGISPRS